MTAARLHPPAGVHARQVQLVCWFSAFRRAYGGFGGLQYCASPRVPLGWA